VAATDGAYESDDSGNSERPFHESSEEGRWAPELRQPPLDFDAARPGTVEELR